MAQKYFDDQFDDEEVLMVFRRHPIVMRKGLVLFMFGPLLGVMPAFIKPDLGFGWFFGGLAAGVALGVVMFIPGWISWFYSVFIVTNHRFIQISQKGLFHKNVVDIGLNQLQMVNYEISGIQQTLLGFGIISLQTYLGELKIKYVHHPASIQKKLTQILRDQGITLQHYSQNQPTNNEET